MVHAGLVPYEEAWAEQRRLHAGVADGTEPDTVLLLEHPPVYTAGKRTEWHERPIDGTPVIDVDRGGKITWHGPGQLVGYPIVRLPDPVDVVVDYVRRLEAALIAVCADLGVEADRVEGRSGVWLAGRRPRAGAQGRRDRHPGRAGRHHARLRAELRPRPHLVRPDRAVRDRRRRRHLAVGRARPRRHGRRGRCRTVEQRLAEVLRRRLSRDRTYRWTYADLVSRSGGPQAAAPRGPQRRDPDREEAAVDQDPRDDGPGVHRAQVAGQARGPAHGLRGGRLPQHLRVLGGPRGHVPHRRRPVHPALRLLPDRHRQARAARPRRAAPGRRVGADDGAALRDDHRRRPRRPARRRRLAVRRDRPPDPRAQPRHRRRAPDPRLQRQARPAGRGVRLAPRGARAQHRDGPADLPADPPGVPLRALARRDHRRPATTAWSPSPT